MSAPKGKERDPEWLAEKSAYDRERYLASRDDRIAYILARRTEAKSRVREMKSAPCLDCGQTFPPCVMEFDHLPGTVKLGTIANLVHNGSWEAVLIEIEKCEVVCANCHRIRTFITRKASPDPAEEFEEFVA